MSRENIFSISYGKLRVPVYRVYATPLSSVPPIAESSFRGRGNVLFSCEVDVEVFGNNFLPAYTRGDNSNVVATDSMKNFILRQALEFGGATYEAYLDHLGRHFLATYPHMESLSLTFRELPFHTVQVPDASSDQFVPSNVLFSRSHDSFATATLAYERVADSLTDSVLVSHRCGCRALELFKVTGSAFSRFVRDEYTTLPERVDRPLFIALDVYWRYRDSSDLVSSNPLRYVPVEQVRDLLQVVFHEFVSESIQHLVHEMGNRLLDRFPQLVEVSFEAHNLTRDLIVVAPEDEKVKVYSDPFPAVGSIKLTVNRG